jgi:hypothetical protein
MRTKRILFHNCPVKRGAVLTSSFLKEALRNRTNERIPNIPEAPKVKKPMPGFLSVPIPKRRDSTKTEIETSSQNRLLV